MSGDGDKKMTTLQDKTNRTSTLTGDQTAIGASALGTNMDNSPGINMVNKTPSM